MRVPAPELAPRDLPFGEDLGTNGHAAADHDLVEELVFEFAHLAHPAVDVAFHLEHAMARLTNCRRQGVLSTEQRSRLLGAIYDAGATAVRTIDTIAPEWIAAGIQGAATLVMFWATPPDHREAHRDVVSDAEAYSRVLRNLLYSAYLLELVDERKAARAAASGSPARAA